MDLKRILLGLFVAAVPLFLSSPAGAQEPRTWTATTGHELKGTLVAFTKTEVKIRDLAGQLKSIPRAKLSDYDKNYVMDFPNLENKATFNKETRPKIAVQAKRVGTGKAAHITAEITLNSSHPKDLDLEVIWVFYADPPKTGAVIRSSAAETLIPLEPRMTRLSLKAKEDLTFLTKDSRASELSNGKRWASSMKIHGFLVQVYTEGQFISGYGSTSTMDKLANDPSLLQTFQD